MAISARLIAFWDKRIKLLHISDHAYYTKDKVKWTQRYLTYVLTSVLLWMLWKVLLIYLYKNVLLLIKGHSLIR